MGEAPLAVNGYEAVVLILFEHGVDVCTKSNLLGGNYRGISLIRNTPLPGPYRRTM